LSDDLFPRFSNVLTLKFPKEKTGRVAGFFRVPVELNRFGQQKRPLHQFRYSGLSF